MINRAADRRTSDRIVYELLRTRSGVAPEVIGIATFSDGHASVDAGEEVAVAVRELLERPFVDRVQADERPRGYRRSGRPQVDLLVPGMPEHFIARMRGLWLPYPDGSVVTARERGIQAEATTVLRLPEPVETTPPVVDPGIRRATLALADETAGGRPLVRAHAPLSGERPRPIGGPRRTDCGWLT